MDTTFKAQIADYGHGRTHVQVKNVPSQFKGIYHRAYGGAFNTDNSELAQALADREAGVNVKSLAGTYRRYLPVELEIVDGGVEITLPEVKSAVSKLFGAVSKLFGSEDDDDPCACSGEDVIYLSEDDIL